MPNDTVANFRLANTNLQAGFARLQPQQNQPSCLQPQDLSGILIELLRAAACCRGISADSANDPEFEKAMCEYRSTVQQLANILPRVHERLLIERARLEIARTHVAATAAWAQASAKTF